MYIDKPKRKLFADAFVAGVGWGIGTILGAALLFALLGILVTRVQAIPFVGEFVYNVIVEVQELQGK